MISEAEKAYQREYHKRYYQANKEKIKAQATEWQKDNDERAKDLRRAWQAANKEKRLAQQRKNYTKPDSARKLSNKKWRRDNPAKLRAIRARREAARIMATPDWANREAIFKIYEECRMTSELTGEEYHVDHIVPLRSKLVCGLHVEWNLQVIEGSENKRKGNRRWPDMP